MRPVRDVPGIAEINLRALAFVCGPRGSRNVHTFRPTTKKGVTV